MKRFLWLTCLSCSMGAFAACGNSGGGKKSGDGGVEDGGDGGGSTNPSALQQEIDQTKKKADDLGTQLDMVKKDVSDLAGLDTRLKKLENPAAPTPLDG